MKSGAYSSKNIRKSLVYFLTGKVASVILGFLMLMLLVRMLTRQEYGGYVALLAIFELLQLGSNFGCFAATFRYVPELRTHNHVQALRRFVYQLLLFRGITLAASVVLLLFFAPTLSQWIGMPWLVDALYLYSVVVMFEGFARYTDVLFDSLLLQGYAQISIILRNALRVGALLMFCTIPHEAMVFSLKWWIMVEAFASFLGAVLSMYFVYTSMKSSEKEKLLDTDIDYIRIRDYVIPAYWAQILGLAQGLDVVKLLVARLADTIQAGAFGFAAAFNSMMQRYLPVFLLIGMVRPLFVSARAQGRSNQDLVGLASLVFKLNLFALCPVYVLMLIEGESVASVLSGGKFPEAGLYLTALLILLLFQTARTIMSLLALAVEESRAGLHGTIYGMAGIVVGVIATKYVGVIALCGGLMASELIACLTIQRALTRHGIKFEFDLLAIFKMGVACGVAILCIVSLQQFLAISIFATVVLSAVIAGSVFLIACYVLKPFQEHERALINRTLQRPLFVW